MSNAMNNATSIVMASPMADRDGRMWTRIETRLGLYEMWAAFDDAPGAWAICRVGDYPEHATFRRCNDAAKARAVFESLEWEDWFDF